MKINMEIPTVDSHRVVLPSQCCIAKSVDRIYSIPVSIPAMFTSFSVTLPDSFVFSIAMSGRNIKLKMTMAEIGKAAEPGQFMTFRKDPPMKAATDRAPLISIIFFMM